MKTKSIDFSFFQKPKNNVLVSKFKLLIGDATVSQNDFSKNFKFKMKLSL